MILETQADITLRTISVVIATVVGTPITWAAIKMIYFLGSIQRGLEEGIKSAASAAAQTNENLNLFIANVNRMLEVHDNTLDEHGERLTTIEVERRTEQRFGRRSTDNPATAEG